VDDPTAVAGIEDARERALTAHRLIDDYQAAIGELSRVRRESLEELLLSGMTQTQIAHLLDMSRSRVSQLLSTGFPSERAFLGAGRLTVAIGGKQEAGRLDPGDVISAETFRAYNLLADLARSVGLDAMYEVVPPPGHVHLNRPNLIVMTSPRLLPFLGQVMEADPHLRFRVDDSGWFLSTADGSQEFRSPRDNGENFDYGYLGRLPRPDGKGTFLYLAGIHAQGTLGAAQYLADNLPTLYKGLKMHRFSVVVKAEFDRQGVQSIRPVTPVYKHEVTR
jgi:hypothetical protein